MRVVWEEKNERIYPIRNMRAESVSNEMVE